MDQLIVYLMFHHVKDLDELYQVVSLSKTCTSYRNVYSYAITVIKDLEDLNKFYHISQKLTDIYYSENMRENINTLLFICEDMNYIPDIYKLYPDDEIHFDNTLSIYSNGSGIASTCKYLIDYIFKEINIIVITPENKLWYINTSFGDMYDVFMCVPYSLYWDEDIYLLWNGKNFIIDESDDDIKDKMNEYLNEFNDCKITVNKRIIKVNYI